MKQLITLTLVLLLALSLTACDSSGNDATTTVPQTSTQETATPTSDTSAKSGTLYAVSGKNSVKEKAFNYEEGKCTPELIAEALSEWTGLKFTISSEKTDTGAIVVEWAESSSFGTGNPPESETSEFQFHDADTLRWFMLNSLCRTIRANLGDVDVYYNYAGDSVEDFDLGPAFNPAIPYNKVEDSRVFL